MVEPGHLIAAKTPRVEPSDAAVDDLVTGMRAFAQRMTPQVAAGGKDLVWSPLSVAMAFAGARAGAAGRTAAELDDAFGYPPEPAVHEAMNWLEQQAVTHDTIPDGASRPPRPTVLAIANGLFPRIGVQLLDRFLHTLASQYGAGVMPLDYTDPDVATRILDAWVAERTNGRIEKLFDRLDPQTLLVLANTTYLRADWQVPFGKEPTTDEPFTRLDGSQRMVSLMHRTDPLNVVQADGWDAVELPYAEGNFAMWVLVPRDLSDPLRLVDAGILGSLRHRVERRSVALDMPRWKSETNAQLVRALQALGVETAFTQKADFSQITDARSLFIDQAMHRAWIAVDEVGTEAAAATGLAFTVSAVAGAEVSVRADHPFAYAIVHRASGAPVFVGVVADPTDPGAAL